MFQTLGGFFSPLIFGTFLGPVRGVRDAVAVAIDVDVGFRVWYFVWYRVSMIYVGGILGSRIICVVAVGIDGIGREKVYV